MCLKELQKLGQEYDAADSPLIFKESPWYQPFLCWLLRHKTYIISTRSVHAEERYLTGAMVDLHIRCQCGREYYQYLKT